MTHELRAAGSASYPPRNPEPRHVTEPLLALYLSLSPERRRGFFATTRKIAGEMGVCSRTVRFWIDHGHIASIRIGKRHLIWRDSVVAFLRSRNGLEEDTTNPPT